MKTLRKVCTCQKLKFSFLLLEYCKIRECYAVEITGACSRKTKIPKKKDILRGKTMKRKNDFFSKKGRRYRALQLQASLRSYHTLQVKFDLHGLCFLVI
jgi:hypothetical protein